MVKNLDDKIKNALIEGTKAAPDLKEEVWESIQGKINQEKGVSRMARKRTNRPSLLRFAAIAAVFVFLFLATTQYGQAAIDKIKILFDPQKNITEEIEGTEEEKEYTLQEGQMGYIIYVDESMYTKEVVDGKDRIVPINKAGNLPEMFMEISQVEDKTPQEAAKQLENDLKGEYAEFENQGKVDDPLEAIHLAANTGKNSNDLYVKYYLVDNTEGGTFVIKLQYILEAAEGHGARFYHMLKEFKVVNLEDLEDIE